MTSSSLSSPANAQPVGATDSQQADLYAPRIEAGGIVFHLRLAGGHRVEHIGIPFEFRGRVFAIHRAPLLGVMQASRYDVADAATGWSIAGLRGETIDQARAVALEAFGRLTPAEWQRKFREMAKRS
ncbi:hypothetical protein [Burkholderia plantarii]|uniref:hypothetical protein n=1 Tax=Burkholderia plantarii TaxID=41899 RepID=UPI0007063E94|nr:hypothetical protein [Burkholderia plantarii]ALK35234.1 hypothetical protein bpln_1p0930 [Burkholderia plantarii]GLZ22862.1 hypothetical protein Bpla01_63910 [Burkholderia plantarii]